MLRSRTHFEQVPLAFAKKVFAEELKQKQAAALAQGLSNEAVEQAPLGQTTVTEVPPKQARKFGPNRRARQPYSII
jgi:hypothetical protein